MNRLIVLMVAGATVAIACPFASATTYYIEPVTLEEDYAIPVTHEEDYAIAGGFITTNGNLGSLTSEDILDYLIDVSGPVPFAFSPTNDSASVNAFFGLTATPTSLSLEMDATPSDDPNPRLFIGANDSTVMNCNDCFQHIVYQNLLASTGGNHTHIKYVFREESNTLWVEANFYQDPQVRLLIASVPEPSCLTLMAWAILVGIGRRRNRKHPA